MCRAVRVASIRDMSSIDSTQDERNDTETPTNENACDGCPPRVEPWKNERRLRRLYHDEGLSQSEIAKRFCITQQTVSYWFQKHGIKAEQEATISKTVRDDGRVLYHVPDGEGGRDPVYRHQLVALLAHDGDDVFATDTHIHHEMGSPAVVDISDNLDVLGEAEHVRLHQGGAGCHHPEVVLKDIQPQANERHDAADGSVAAEGDDVDDEVTEDGSYAD